MEYFRVADFANLLNFSIIFRIPPIPRICPFRLNFVQIPLLQGCSIFLVLYSWKVLEICYKRTKAEFKSSLPIPQSMIFFKLSAKARIKFKLYIEIAEFLDVEMFSFLVWNNSTTVLRKIKGKIMLIEQTLPALLLQQSLLDNLNVTCVFCNYCLLRKLCLGYFH